MFKSVCSKKQHTIQFRNLGLRRAFVYNFLQIKKTNKTLQRHLGGTFYFRLTQNEGDIMTFMTGVYFLVLFFLFFTPQ